MTDARKADRSSQTSPKSNTKTNANSNAKPQSTTISPIQRAVAEQLGPAVYERWLAGADWSIASNDALHLAVDRSFAATWIDRHLRDRIRDAARTVKADIELTITHDPNIARDRDQIPGRDAEAMRSGLPAASRDQARDQAGELGRDPLADAATHSVARENQSAARADFRPHGSPAMAGDPRQHHVYAGTPRAPRASRGDQAVRWRSLETYIVGASNELAFRAASQVAESPELPGVSPLFIHGNCGVGKTHLLQGVCQRFRSMHRTATGRSPRVRYVTGEEFTNEFITAVRRGELDAFRRRVRSLDLLAIDDVHFFSNKDKTQYEFMHTIDAIDLKGSRLVVASDEHPKLIRNFRQALVSRCLSGMVVEVQRPDRATRIRIIHRLAAARGLDFSDAAVQQLASHCVGSVRELEGAIIKVAAIQGLLGDNRGEVGMQVIDQLMNEADFQPKVPIRIASIVDSVCERTGVDRQDLLSSSKRRDAVLGRGLVAFLARSMTNLSFPEIAREMGRAHHSTFHAADRRLATRIREEDVVTFGRDPRPILLRELVDQIRHDVQSRTGRPR